MELAGEFRFVVEVIRHAGIFLQTCKTFPSQVTAIAALPDISRRNMPLKFR